MQAGDLAYEDLLKRKEKERQKTFESSVNERGTLFYFWSLLVSFAILYNMAACSILVFEAFRKEYFNHWLVLNGCADLVYLLDMAVLSRKNFHKDGVKVITMRGMLVQYRSSSEFVYDVLSVWPTDFLLLWQPNWSLIRCNRFLKAYRLKETFHLAERRAYYHTGFAILRILMVSVMLFHWNACAYYALSVWSDTVIQSSSNLSYQDVWAFTPERIRDPIVSTMPHFTSVPICAAVNWESQEDRTDCEEQLRDFWSNRSETLKSSLFAKEYAQSFYWSSLTMTTLGEQPSPNLSEQTAFEIFDTIVGVLIFAVIMGSVADVIAASNAFKSDMQFMIDGLKDYMKYRRLDNAIKFRVLNYCRYVLHQEILLDESVGYVLLIRGEADESYGSVLEIRSFMPDKLFLRVNHFMQPTVFQKSLFFVNLEMSFLRDLASRLVLFKFGPGDMVTDIGDFHKEMIIVCSGELVVCDAQRLRLRTLGQGDIFADSSLIWIGGDPDAHRHKVIIESEGFSEVYVLQRSDLMCLLSDYPLVRSQLVQRARTLHRRFSLPEAQPIEEDGEPFNEDIEGLTLIERCRVIQQRIRVIENILNLSIARFTSSSARQKQKIHQLECVLGTLIERNCYDSDRTAMESTMMEN